MAIVGTIQDITEQKLVEQELQQSRKNLEEAQRIAKIGHFDFNLKNEDTHWSLEFYRIFGFDINHFRPEYKKYRDRKNVLTWKELSTFYALCLKTGPWERYVVMTNCDYTRQAVKTEKDLIICKKKLQGITKEEWLDIKKTLLS